jgi:DNA-binding protein YbaB
VPVFSLHGLQDLEREVRTLLDETRTKWTQFAEQTFVGESDEGRIRAVVGSGGSVREVTVHVLSKRRHDNLTLGDLICEAIQNAQRAADEARERLMSEPNIFGFSAKALIEDPQSLVPRFDT